MIIPLIKYILTHTSNNITLLTSDDRFDLYINLIMISCANQRVTTSRKCSIHKSSIDTLTDLYEINPQAHVMWSSIHYPD